MVEAPFGLFEVKVEGVFWDTLERCDPYLCHAPETFDAIDMNRPPGEF